MTDLLTEIDFMVEVVNEDEFDTPRPCDWNKNYPEHRCKKPAKWKVTLVCCGATLFFCEEHMDTHLDGIAAGLTFQHGRPDGCGATDMKIPFASAERI